MGSLNNGQHISQSDTVVKNLGHKVETSSPLLDNETITRFLPNQLDGIALWLDSKDIANIGIDYANNNAVRYWKSRVYNGPDITFTSPGQNPIWTERGILLANGQYLYTEMTPITSVPFTVFVVATPTDVSQGVYAFNIKGVNNNWWGVGIFGHLNPKKIVFRTQGDGGGPVSATSNGNLEANTKYIISCVASSTTSRIIYINSEEGTTSTNDISPDVDRMLIGRWSSDTEESDTYIGYIHEILIYNNALTSEQRTQVEEYLSSKWSIELSA